MLLYTIPIHTKPPVALRFASASLSLQVMLRTIATRPSIRTPCDICRFSHPLNFSSHCRASCPSLTRFSALPSQATGTAGNALLGGGPLIGGLAISRLNNGALFLLLSLNPSPPLPSFLIVPGLTIGT